MFSFFTIFDTSFFFEVIVICRIFFCVCRKICVKNEWKTFLLSQKERGKIEGQNEPFCYSYSLLMLLSKKRKSFQLVCSIENEIVMILLKEEIWNVKKKKWKCVFLSFFDRQWNINDRSRSQVSRICLLLSKAGNFSYKHYSDTL